MSRWVRFPAFWKISLSLSSGIDMVVLEEPAVSFFKVYSEDKRQQCHPE
jgi:hypothetical protein